jgi:hypothetical protein
LNKKELLIFAKELKYWLRPESFPPEFQSDNLKPNISLLADIWSLGTLIRELTSMGSLSTPPITYSKKLLDLQEMMLKPNQRPTPGHILNYLAENPKPTKTIAPVVKVEQSDIRYLME